MFYGMMQYLMVWKLINISIETKNNFCSTRFISNQNMNIRTQW